MADVVDFAAPHAAMRAHAARGLESPVLAGLIVKAAGLHPVILASASRIKKIDRRINVAGSGKEIEFFCLLALE